MRKHNFIIAMCMGAIFVATQPVVCSAAGLLESLASVAEEAVEEFMNDEDTKRGLEELSNGLNDFWNTLVETDFSEGIVKEITDTVFGEIVNLIDLEDEDVYSIMKDFLQGAANEFDLSEKECDELLVQIQELTNQKDLNAADISKMSIAAIADLLSDEGMEEGKISDYFIDYFRKRETNVDSKEDNNILSGLFRLITE